MVKKRNSQCKVWIALGALLILFLAILLLRFTFSCTIPAGDGATEGLASMGPGALIDRIFKQDERCRVIGIDIATNELVVSCFYGTRVENTKIKQEEEVTNIRILAKEEIYLGGTFTGEEYNRDGYYVGKYNKDFKYNDNADIFWKVEVGLNGSTLEYCSMRDQEYADTSRTKEECQSLYIDIR
ncbi:hypothetical protein A3K73_09075 [Candidatus Pacearchaeota archaeon RBG_13_36_9]|nr:MAG: hypothetical protein A3K73_09075 [Candidatus Pacearchaeota archaeon RBG_13_36_9]